MRHGIPHSYFGTSLGILESNRVSHAPSRNLGECHLKMKLGTALAPVYTCSVHAHWAAEQSSPASPTCAMCTFQRPIEIVHMVLPLDRETAAMRRAQKLASLFSGRWQSFYSSLLLGYRRKLSSDNFAASVCEIHLKAQLLSKEIIILLQFEISASATITLS